MDTNTKFPEIQDINSLLQHCCLCLGKINEESFKISTSKFINMSLLNMYIHVTKLPHLPRLSGDYPSDFPYRVCKACCLKLAECHKFIKVCKETHQFLTETVNLLLTNKEEVSLTDCINSTEVKEKIKLEIDIEEQKVDLSHLIGNQSMNQEKDKISRKRKYKKREVCIKPKSEQVDPIELASLPTISNNTMITLNNQQYELIFDPVPVPQTPILSKCDLCDYKTFYKDIFKAHVFTKHPLNAIKCLLCDKSFDTKWKYIKHSCNLGKRGYSQHKTTNGVYVCTKCSQEFENIIDLFNHLNHHDNDTEFVCFLCKKDFPQEDSLDTHIGQEHSFAIVL